MRFVGSIALAIAVGVLAEPAFATITFCSDPDRAGIRDSVIVALPTDSIDVFMHRFDKIAESINMLTGAVVASDGDGTVTSKSPIMQSDDVSVVISGRWEPGDHAIRVTVERTCIADPLSPWQPYWSGFLRELRAAGYRIQ